MASPTHRTERRGAAGLAILLASSSCMPALTARVATPQRATAPVAIATATATATADPSPLLLRPPADVAAATRSIAAAAPPFVASDLTPDAAGRAAECLTAAVYYEARSEPVDGQRAVAQVVLNRVRNPAFPASVCGTVYQRASTNRGCQFSFACDGSMLQPRDPVAWRRAARIAADALAGGVYAPVGSATFYHTTSILPWWAPSLARVATIGAHIFYRLGDGWRGALDFRQAYARAEPAGGAADTAARPATLLAGLSLPSVAGVTVHSGAIRIADVTVHHGIPDAPAEPPADPGAADDGGAAVHVHSGAMPADGAESPT